MARASSTGPAGEGACSKIPPRPGPCLVRGTICPCTLQQPPTSMAGCTSRAAAGRVETDARSTGDRFKSPKAPSRG
eukprot:5075900-Prymnesium_polylepis.1